MKNLKVRSLFALRLAMGWLMFYAGITKVLDPQWTASGYLSGAKTFAGFYEWLATPMNIGWIDFINQWGLTLLGISLIFGVGVKWSSRLGAILMVLYYLPALEFPYVDHGFLIDDHIVYAIVLIYFSESDAGKTFGLKTFFQNNALVKKYGFLGKLLE